MHDFNTVFVYKQNSHFWNVSSEGFHNRAFLFGDGLFETMVFSDGSLLDFELHRERLLTGMNLLFLDSKSLSTAEELQGIIIPLLPSNTHARIRWNVFRAGMGKYTPESHAIGETLQIQVLTSAPAIKKTAFISSKHVLFPHPWANCKTSNALIYVLANQERLLLQQDEIILLDNHGNVSEAGAANIFWKKNGTYYTPSLSTNCIAGIGRHKIIQYLKLLQLPLAQGEFAPRDMMKADKVFTSNVTGISYLSQIEGKVFNTDPEPILEALFVKTSTP
jgi:4-amino-4-deoxychorismate lyase